MYQTILLQISESTSDEDSDENNVDYSKFNSEVNDETFINTEEERGVRRSDETRFLEAQEIAQRFEVSKRAYTLIVNSVLSDLNMEQLMVSPSSVQRWENEAGVETVKEYDKEMQNLYCVKFDGGTEKISVGKYRMLFSYIFVISYPPVI